MIVFVHADPETRRTLSDALHDVGLGVETFASGEEAIDALRENAPDLVVTNVKLGTGMNGFELGRRIRERHPHTRAIYLSMFSNSLRPVRVSHHELLWSRGFGVDQFVRNVMSELLH